MKRNYNPTKLPGDTRVRIWKIEGYNENVLFNKDAVPYINYEEETVVRLASTDPNMTETRIGVGATIQQFYKPESLIVMRNPTTDEAGPVGRLPAHITMAEAFAVLYSMGRQAQTQRDIQELA